MQAIRVLRAQSRPASPSPAPSPLSFDSVSHANGSHAVVSDDHGVQRMVNPITRIQNLSLTSFAKRASTPPPSPSPTPSTIVQDGTYLNTLGGKLNEAATRVLAMPVVNSGGTDLWKGKRPIPAGRGRAFAVLIETELDASQGNVNLRHAILRLLPRSFHVLISNISTQLSQLLTHPSYIPTNPHTALHPATLHGLALAQFCSEILETFTSYKICNATSDLAVIKSHLDAIIARVTAPLFAQLQTEMNAMLEPIGQASTNSPFAGTKEKMNKCHPAVMNLGQNMPVIGRALRRYTFDTCPATQKALATFLINTLWTSMVQLSHRAPTILPAEPTHGTLSGAHKSSFHSLAHALTPPGSPMMKRLSPPASPPIKAKKLTPPNSPPAKKRVLALPQLGGSPLVNTLALGDAPRAPRRADSSGSLEGSGRSSPDKTSATTSGTNSTSSLAFTPSTSTLSRSANSTVASAWLTSLAIDAKALVDILSSSEVPRPVEGSLPREAVDETFERLSALGSWLVGGAVPTASGVSGLGKLLDEVPEEVPLLIVLPILLGEAWVEHYSLTGGATIGMEKPEFPGMPKILGYESEESYRRTVACGFRRADECEGMFGGCVLDRLSIGVVAEKGWAVKVRDWLGERMGC